jgi:hypothetical protein
MGVIQLGQRNIRPHVSPRNGLAVHAKLPSYSKIKLNECHISPFYRRYISQRLRVIPKAGTDDNADIIDDDDLETEQEDDILEDDIDFNDADDLIDIDGTFLYLETFRSLKTITLRSLRLLFLRLCQNTLSSFVIPQPLTQTFLPNR